MARFEEIKQTPEIANSLSQELDILKNTKKEMIVLCNKEVETDEDRKAFDDFKKLVNYLNDMNIVIDLFQKFTDEFYEKGVSVFEWTVEVALKFDLKDLSRFGISQKVIEGVKNAQNGRPAYEVLDSSDQWIKKEIDIIFDRYVNIEEEYLAQRIKKNFGKLLEQGYSFGVMEPKDETWYYRFVRVNGDRKVESVFVRLRDSEIVNIESVNLKSVRQKPKQKSIELEKYESAKAKLLKIEDLNLGMYSRESSFGQDYILSAMFLEIWTLYEKTYNEPLKEDFFYDLGAVNQSESRAIFDLFSSGHFRFTVKHDNSPQRQTNFPFNEQRSREIRDKLLKIAGESVLYTPTL